MGQHRLRATEFLAVCEMVAAQLRIKESDRWSEAICKLKFVSFTSEFPEVSCEQLLWAAEQWIQATAGREFLRYPTWRELLAPLYRCEGGLANRTWGFRDDLPPALMPTASQKALLPKRAQSLLPPPDPSAAHAYQLVGAAAESQRLLPAAEPERAAAGGLSQEDWQQYLERRREA